MPFLDAVAVDAVRLALSRAGVLSIEVGQSVQQCVVVCGGAVIWRHRPTVARGVLFGFAVMPAFGESVATACGRAGHQLDAW